MKKFSFALTVFLMIAGIILKACPPGYGPQNTTTFYIGSCQMEVKWCCPTNWSGPSPYDLPPVSIDKVSLLNDCSGALQQSIDINGDVHWEIPWDKVYMAIYNSGLGCYSRVFDPEDCATGHPLSGIVYDGWCYRWVGPSMSQDGEFHPSHYEQCGQQPNLADAKCYQSVKICYKLINGVQVLTLVWGDVQEPLFTCEPNCKKGCQLGE